VARYRHLLALPHATGDRTPTVGVDDSSASAGGATATDATTLTATTATEAARLLAWTTVATSRRVVTLMVGTCAGFALASVSGVVTLTGCTNSICLTAITIHSLLSDTIGARLTAAIAALLITTAVLTTTTATAAVTSTTAEATTMAPTTLTAASAIAPATTVMFGRNAASRRGNNLELRQAGHRQRPLEHPLNVLEQRSLIRRHE
jgi:hypothetical protein